MKRLSIALAALGLSAGALAALPATTDPTLVAVPQLPGGFVIGVTGYYLEPSVTDGDLDFATVSFGTTSFFSSRIESVEPGYDWGWGVNVGYIFPNTGNDVNLSYFHYSSDEHRNAIFFPPSATFLGFITPFDINGFDLLDFLGADSFFSASARAEFDLDQVDLTAGQFIDVGCRLILHPYAGVRWASLERKIDRFFQASFTSVTSTSTLTLFGGSADITEKSDFDGVGPLVGIDASYYIGWGFGAVAHFDSALLIGNIDDRVDLFTRNASIVTPIFSTFSFRSDDNRRLVPVMDGKLGLDYTYVFNNAANSDLTLEAGWQASNYFNAIDRLSFAVAPGVVAIGTPATAFITAHRTSDFGLQGPYVSLVLHV